MMFGRKNDLPTDAGAALEKAEAERISGEYGGSSLETASKKSPPGAKGFLVVCILLVLGVGGAFSYKAWKNIKEKEVKDSTPVAVVAKVVETPKPRPIVAEPAEVFVPAKPQQPQQPPVGQQPPQANQQPPYGGPPVKTAAELIRERMLSSSLSSGNEHATEAYPANAAPAGGMFGNSNGGGGDLAEKLQPMRLNGSTAGLLKNRDLLLTQSAMIDCVLESKLITTQPGMTKCRLTRDIYSTTGKVVLLDKGTLVTGFYQGGITQGQARIFVQWSRAETPSGVIVNLDSPGAGPLGESGVGGWIETHFWQRFGGAIMISMIGDLGQYASGQGRSSGDNSIQFSNTSQGASEAATEALRNSINIPPTLYKNAGERVSIFVARDLDFSDVYSLNAE